MKISEVLRRLRKVNKLTQDELARKLGVSASYLSLLERDKRPATMRVLHSASNWLGIAAGLFLLQAMELDALSPPQQKLVREVRRELKKAILTGDYRLLKLISRGRFKLPAAGTGDGRRRHDRRRRTPMNPRRAESFTAPHRRPPRRTESG